MRSSRGEIKIEDILKTAGLVFREEYSFKDLVSLTGRPLRFDFAVFDDEGEIDFLIEFQGIQHYDGLNHGWSNPEKFEEVQKHDNIKFSYCQEHSIPLYYITYLENIEERLKEIVNELYC